MKENLLLVQDIQRLRRQTSQFHLTIQTFLLMLEEPRTDYKFSVDPMITGDWDNGNSHEMDGPYVNRGG